MNVQKLLVYFIMLMLSACSLKHENRDEMEQYSANPNLNDSLCINDENRAKADIKNGVVSFCCGMGMAGPLIRGEKYLVKLCEKYHLQFQTEMYNDVIREGQTQGCYEGYMDRIIEKKYGNGFKKRLLYEADSMLIASNDTIEYYFCDEHTRPHLPGQVDAECTLAIPLNKDLKHKLNYSENGDYLFMDIRFYIDTIGNPSSYYLQFYDAKETKTNGKYEDELWKIALAELKKYPHWVPGEINGHKVVTDNNVRVQFYWAK